MTREEAEKKDIWTAGELLDLPKVTDLNGKILENGQIVTMQREPWKGKKAKVIIDLITDRNPYWFVYQLLDEPKQKINHKVMWEGLKDWTQKVVID